MHTAEHYREALRALLPPGQLWPESITSMVSSFLEAIAQEFARLEEFGYGLLDEVDPRTTTQLLSDWERVAGLPDPCHGLGETVQARRAELIARLTAQGSLSRQFYIDVAAAFGFAITIDEFDESNPGPGGLGYSGQDWRHVWRVNAPAVNTTTVFRVGESRCGERLRAWGNQPFECLFARIKPLHTRVLHAYV